MEDQFAVFYQPILDLASNQPVAFEALLRWDHPERGYVAPVSFIDVAEQTGLIIPIGKWILETACDWVAGLDSTSATPPAISVNISPRQLADPGFAEDVFRVLDSTGLVPSPLHLEVTESMALSTDSAAATLGSLRDAGVRVAIDDFGTGYAALSLLQDLHVDIVKIDGTFVKGIEVDSVNEAIVAAIVRMAKALDFYVVAEGVETSAELDVLRPSRCDAVQGSHLCRPLPREKLEARMALPDAWANEESVD